MWESVHAEDDYNVNTVVRFHQITELVFIDDFFWYVSDFHPDVFGALKWSIEVEVGDVHGHEACSGGGNYTVEKNFGCQHVGGGCGDLTGVVDLVAAHHETRAIGFFLLRPYGTHELTIRDIFKAIFGDITFADETYGVGALYPASDAVCQASKLVG